MQPEMVWDGYASSVDGYLVAVRLKKNFSTVWRATVGTAIQAC
jgi:hypothetical protein